MYSPWWGSCAKYRVSEPPSSFARRGRIERNPRSGSAFGFPPENQRAYPEPVRKRAERAQPWPNESTSRSNRKGRKSNPHQWSPGQRMPNLSRRPPGSRWRGWRAIPGASAGGVCRGAGVAGRRAAGRRRPPRVRGGCSGRGGGWCSTVILHLCPKMGLRGGCTDIRKG